MPERTSMWRTRIAATLRERWQDPTFRAAAIAATHSSEALAKKRPKIIAANKRPRSEATRQKVSVSMKAAWQAPGTSARLRAGLKQPGRRASYSAERNAKIGRASAIHVRAWWATKSSAERAQQTQAAREIAIRTRESSLERVVATILDVLGITYERQASLGTYHVDFLIIEQGLVIECDGLYWHRIGSPSANRQAERDAAISAQGLRVIHLGEAQIRSDAAACVSFALAAAKEV